MSGLTYFCKCNITLALNCCFLISAFITTLELHCVHLYTILVGTRDFCILLKCAVQVSLQRIGMHFYTSFAHEETEEQRNKSLKCLRNHSFYPCTSTSCKNCVCPIVFDDSEISNKTVTKYKFDSGQSLEELLQLPAFLKHLFSCVITGRDERFWSQLKKNHSSRSILSLN